MCKQLLLFVACQGLQQLLHKLILCILLLLTQIKLLLCECNPPLLECKLAVLKVAVSSSRLWCKELCDSYERAISPCLWRQGLPSFSLRCAYSSSIIYTCVCTYLPPRQHGAYAVVVARLLVQHSYSADQTKNLLVLHHPSPSEPLSHAPFH